MKASLAHMFSSTVYHIADLTSWSSLQQVAASCHLLLDLGLRRHAAQNMMDT